MSTNAKIKKGITGVAFALATLNTDGQGNQSVTYGDVENLVTTTSGGRSYSCDPRGDSQDVYADSVKVYGESQNDGYDIGLGLLSMLDGVVRKKWLQYDEVEQGLAEYANKAENPYFALIIYEDTTDGVGQTTIFYWAQANGRPSDSGKTAEGGAFDFEFPEIPIAATPRPTDRLVRVIKPGKTKLTTVPEPGQEDQTPFIGLATHTLPLTEDDEFPLGATVTPADETITWNSGSTAVATVADGVITAEGAGNTIITASITVDGVTYTDTCTVIVTAKT